MAREARENLSSEIARNRKAIEDWLPQIRESQAQLKRIVEVTQKLESSHNAAHLQLSYNVDFPSLYSGSWSTANRSGAVTYMSYDEIERYSDLYELQQTYATIQNQALTPLVELGGLMPTILSKDLKKVPEQKLEEIERAANRGIMMDQAMENIGKSLDEEYTKFTREK
jgi:hypothetical protein